MKNLIKIATLTLAIGLFSQAANAYPYGGWHGGGYHGGGFGLSVNLGGYGYPYYPT